MTEEQPFTLIAKYPGFEVRHYPTYVLVQVETKGEFTSAASRAFRPLVNYISGNNKAQEKFAMTAPVLHAPDKKALITPLALCFLKMFLLKICQYLWMLR